MTVTSVSLSPLVSSCYIKCTKLLSMNNYTYTPLTALFWDYPGNTTHVEVQYVFMTKCLIAFQFSVPWSSRNKLVWFADLGPCLLNSKHNILWTLFYINVTYLLINICNDKQSKQKLHLYLCMSRNFLPEWWSKLKFSSQNLIKQIITILRFTASQHKNCRYSICIYNKYW